MTNLVAPKPGQPPLKLEKRTADVSVYEIQCSNLMESTNHRFFGTPTHNVSNSKINVDNIKLLNHGSSIQLTVSGGEEVYPYKDFNFTVSLKSTNGGLRTIPIILRTFSS